MRREEGQGLMAQMDCAELWNVSSGKSKDKLTEKSIQNHNLLVK
jgi:hypothetical protein